MEEKAKTPSLSRLVIPEDGPEGGYRRFAGEYEIVKVDEMTTRELRVIKNQTGLRAGELADAFAAGDADALNAITAVPLMRTERWKTDEIWDELLDVTVVKIAAWLGLDIETEEGADAGPPAVTTTGGGESKSSTGNGHVTSGVSSPRSSESPESVPSRSGAPGSDTTSAFAHPI